MPRAWRAACTASGLALVAALGTGAVLPQRFVASPVPAAPGSLAPVLSEGPDGQLVLSWLEPAGKRHALRFSEWRDGAWRAPRTVLVDDSLFVNWADVPSVVPAGGERLVAHWLRRTAGGTYDYAVKLARSADGGRNWTVPVSPHHDGLLGEHGFVSLVPWPEGGMAALWLDGRGMTGEGGGHAAGHDGGMTLRHAVLGPDGEAGHETLLDVRTCECCQTGAARTRDGLVVVYRDRSEREVRDIYCVRWQAGRWSDPQRVAADGWEIAGCPVNGPAIAARDDQVVVAWFTAPRDSARVLLSRSNDGGRTFATPVRVDEGSPTGRADVALLADGSAAVCWIEGEKGPVRIRARRVAADGALGAPVTVAASSSARRAGFPRLVAMGDWLVCAWTDPAEPLRIRSAAASQRVLPR